MCSVIMNLIQIDFPGHATIAFADFAEGLSSTRKTRTRRPPDHFCWLVDRVFEGNRHFHLLVWIKLEEVRTSISGDA